MRSLSGTRVLVTGGAGFLAGHLITRLNELGALVWRTSRRKTGTRSESQLVGDLRDADFCSELLVSASPEIIFHTAGTTGSGHGAEAIVRHVEGNVYPTVRLLAAAAESVPEARIVVTSSAAVYGSAPSPVAESAPLAPQTPYGVSKAAQELSALQQHLADDRDVVRVRPFNLIGPGQHSVLVVPELCRQVAAAEQLGGGEIHIGNLSPRRDFLDVRDAVDALITVSLAGASGSVYNIGSGMAIGIQELVDLLFGMSATPLRVVVDERKKRAVEIAESYADISSLASLTEWRPRISLVESVRAALDYARRPQDQGGE